MKPEQIQRLRDVCIVIGKIKQQIIDELPHYGHKGLFFQNDEITTGYLNNNTEIKIHLIANILTYFKNENMESVDLSTNDISSKLKQIIQKNNLKTIDVNLKPLSFAEIKTYLDFAIKSKRILELFRMKLYGKISLIHLWPDHFDFSLEWFSGHNDEQIGIGISPGDEQFATPYAYVTPYPFNDKITQSKLPIGQWNTTNWYGIKVEFSDLEKLDTVDAANKLYDLFKIAKTNFELS